MTTPLNVYCGKDKRLEEEQGNVIYKALILENVERYNRESEKARKMMMTTDILDEFRIRSNGGQFYRYCEDINDWVLCDDGWARDKLSHALRYQIKRKVRRPQLKRKLSLPDKDSPKAQNKRRSRSESFESCPGKIESVPTQDLSESSIDESILVDPLTLFDEMVSTGELEQFYASFMYNDEIVSKNADIGDLYHVGESLADTEYEYGNGWIDSSNVWS